MDDLEVNRAGLKQVGMAMSNLRDSVVLERERDDGVAEEPLEQLYGLVGPARTATRTFVCVDELGHRTLLCKGNDVGLEAGRRLEDDEARVEARERADGSVMGPILREETFSAAEGSDRLR